MNLKQSRQIRFFLLLGVMLLCVISAAHWLLPASGDSRKVTYAVAVDAAPVQIDPRYTTDAAGGRLWEFLTPGLVRLDARKAAELVLAENFMIDEGFVDVLLRKDVAWPDGSVFDAESVKAYYEAAQAMSPPTAYNQALKKIRRIEILNDYGLRFYVPRQDPYVVTILTLPFVQMDKGVPRGLSDYRITRYDAQGNVTVKHKKTGKTARFEVMKDPLVRLMKLRTGAIDIIHSDVPQELITMDLAEKFRVMYAASSSYTYIGFNLKDRVTGQKAVREAVQYGVDKQALMQALLAEHAAPAESVLMPGHQAYWPAENVGYDAEKARQALLRAGYSPEKPARIQFSITTDPFGLRVAQAIQAQLKPLGVDIHIASSEWGTFYANVKKGTVQMFMLTWVGAFDTDVFEFLYHSSMMPPEGANRGRYANAQVDAWIDTMKRTPRYDVLDLEEHNALAVKVQQQVANDIVYVPLWRKPYITIVWPDIPIGTIPANGGYREIFNLLAQPEG